MASPEAGINNAVDRVPTSPSGAGGAGTCGTCGKPLDRETIKMFGYFCSPECRETSRRQVTEADREQREKNQREIAKAALLGKAMAGLVLLVILLVAAWIAWVFFLDPAGKVCWRRPASECIDQSSVLAVSGKNVLLRSGKQALLVDAAAGRIGKPATAEALAAERLETVSVGERVVGIGENAMVVATSADGQAREIPFAGTPLSFGVAADGRRLAVYVNPPLPEDVKQALEKAEKKYEETGRYDEAEFAKIVRPQHELRCIDLDSGKELWVKKMKREVSIERLTVIDGKLAGIFRKVGKSGDGKAGDEEVEAGSAECLLCCLDLADGKQLWRTKLDDYPTWGPKAFGELLLVAEAENLFAFSPDGQEKWSVSCSGMPVESAWEQGIMLLSSGDKLECYKAETGAKLWDTAIDLCGETVVGCGENRIVFQGVTPQPKKKKEKKAEEVAPVSAPISADKSLDTVMKELGMSSGAGAPQLPSLICLDATTGKPVWVTPNSYGRLYGNKQRLVMVMDTSETSHLEALTGGRGVLVIRQYAPATGKMLYSRQSDDISLGATCIVDRYLVAFAWPRKEKSGVLSGFSGVAHQVSERLKTESIVCFRLK